MKLASVLTLFFYMVVANANPLISPKNQDAPDGKYPYVVSLRQAISGIPEHHFCSGSIINNRWILTAASCLLDSFFERNITVVAGTNISDGDDNNKQVFRAVDRVLHDKYANPTIFDYDIGLIRVDRDIEFNDKVQPVKLTTEDFYKVGYPVTLIGWTYKDEDWGRNAADNLQEVTLELVDQATCREEWTDFLDTTPTDNNICLSSALQEDNTCFSESGSPVIADGIQIGIVSDGQMCYKSLPELSTKIFHFLDWIAENVAEF